ncbi:MAG: hypothetical protein CVU84_16110 [Firmicutes bacterium HGW-Firmicutes-1]|nr:MAG: hypothetical protein CVU84_16110 [Firmicutes bacterium HGW-Firmicutes-1]
MNTKLSKRLRISILFTAVLLILFIFIFIYKTYHGPSSALLQKEELIISYTPESIQKEMDDFNTWTTCLVPDIISSSPLAATFMYHDLKALGLEELTYQLDDFSPSAFHKKIQKSRLILDELANIDYDLLSYEQKETYEMLEFQNQLIVNGEPYIYYNHIIEPSSGIQMNLLLALIQIDLSTKEDVDAYLMRLQQIPRLFNQLIEYEKVKATKGLLMPRELYDLVILQLDSLLVEPENFLLYLSFEDRIDEMINMDHETKEAYKFACLSIISEQIYPAYEKLITSINDTKKLANTDQGICSFQNGQNYYKYIIKKETSYDMSVEELRGWVTNELYNTMGKVEQLYADYPELMEYEELTCKLPTYDSLEDLYAVEEKCLNEQFYDYDIDRASEYVIPSYLEDYVAAGFYFPVAIDGEEYGNMYLQESAYTNINSTTLELYFHENIPGHHMYFSKFYESDLPMIRKVCSWLPYEEGWAQYVQGISIDYYGLEEPFTQLLKATSKLSYYYMLLIDIRYHYDGISSTEALQAFLDLGFPKESAQRIVNRMIAHPGEIIHYVYGGYKIEGYLEQSKQSLGNNFDIKDFHDMILVHAELPFTTMDNVVEKYISH